MKRYRRLLRLTIALVLLGTFEAPAFAGGAGWALFAATLGLYAVSAAPYGWYSPYYSEPYPYGYPRYYDEYQAYEPAYDTTSPTTPSRYHAVPYHASSSDAVPYHASPSDLRPSLPNMTRAPGEAIPANEIPRHEIKKVSAKLSEVRALLNKKAAAGAITAAQKDQTAVYLTQIERVAQAQAAAQKGLLSSDQQESLLKELSQVETTVNKNFVSF